MRYSGKIGYAESVETAPGVWEDVITERDYIGDVIQSTETLTTASSILPEYRTTTSVSVLSDGVLKQNYSDVRYLSYLGELWTVTSAINKWPRIEFYIGEVYNGPTAD